MTSLEVASIIANLATVLSVIGIAIRWFYLWAFNRGVRQTAHAEKQLRYLYGPLSALLIDTHISSFSGVRYSYISIRIRRARRFLKSYEYTKAITALFDKGVTDYGSEVEYGSSFPLGNAGRIIEENASVADTKLLLLYKAVRREEAYHMSTDEPYSSNMLSKNYLDLFDHIYNRHKYLSKMLNP